MLPMKVGGFMSALLIFCAMVVTCVLSFAGSLTLVARWLRYPKRGFGRALAVVGIWLALGILGFYVEMKTADVPFSVGIAWMWVVVLLVMPALEVLPIRYIYRATLGRALAGWGMVLIVRVAVIVLYLVTARVFLLEAFRVTTLSMAPTQLCIHATSVCSRCGGTLLVALEENPYRSRFEPTPAQIDGYCMNCRQETAVPKASLVTEPADRFFVAKFLSPQRWDLVAFRHANIMACKRIVAFPGEELVIDPQGKVSVNGHPLDSPEGVPSLFHWLDLPGANIPMALKPDTPLRLGADEYFVVGDFGEHSSDSRMYGPIHKADIVGVVTMVYWPPSRVRIVR
jgi:signal peptidase I